MGIAGAMAPSDQGHALGFLPQSPLVEPEFCPDGDLGSSYRPFPRGCRGAMGIAGGLWSVKPEPFCLFLGAAEVF